MLVADVEGSGGAVLGLRRVSLAVWCVHSLIFSSEICGRFGYSVVRGSTPCATLAVAEALWAVHRHPQGAN